MIKTNIWTVSLLSLKSSKTKVDSTDNVLAMDLHTPKQILWQIKSYFDEHTTVSLIRPISALIVSITFTSDVETAAIVTLELIRGTCSFSSWRGKHMQEAKGMGNK